MSKTSLERALAAKKAIDKSNEAAVKNQKAQTRLDELQNKHKRLTDAKDALDKAITDAQPTWKLSAAAKWAIGTAFSLGGYEPMLIHACPLRDQEASDADSLFAPLKLTANQCDIEKNRANTAKAGAISDRIAQLSAPPGHGPQRHSTPDHATLKRRAIYGLDPETGSQIEIKNGNAVIHNSGGTASKFKTPEDYVIAEAAMREELMNVVTVNDTFKKLDPPLTQVFLAPDNHCEGFQPVNPPPRVMTTLGPVRQVPNNPPPYHHPPAPIFPPDLGATVNYPAPPPGEKLPLGSGILSNNYKGKYRDLANEIVKDGGSLANAQAAVDHFKAQRSPPPPILGNAAAVIAAKNHAMPIPPPPLVPASDPVDMADMDGAAMDLVINDPTRSSAPSFAGGNFTAIYKKQGGNWKLITMYPEP